MNTAMPEYDYTLKKEDFNTNFFELKLSAKKKEEPKKEDPKKEDPKKETPVEKPASTIAKSTSLHTAKKYIKKIPVIESIGDEDDSNLMDHEDYDEEIPGSNSDATKLALEKYEDQKKINDAQEEFDRKDFNGEILIEKDEKVSKVNEEVKQKDPSLKIIESLISAKTKDIKIDDYLKLIISTFEFLDYSSRAQILCYIIYGKLFSHLMYEGNQTVEKSCKKIVKNENFVKTISLNKGSLNEEIFDLVKKYSTTVTIKGTSLSIFNKFVSVIPKLVFGFYVEELENLDSDLVIPLNSRNFLASIGGRHNSFKSEVICKFLIGTQKIVMQTKSEEAKTTLLKKNETKKKVTREINADILENEYNDYEQYDNEY